MLKINIKIFIIIVCVRCALQIVNVLSEYERQWATAGRSLHPQRLLSRAKSTFQRYLSGDACSHVRFVRRLPEITVRLYAGPNAHTAGHLLAKCIASMHIRTPLFVKICKMRMENRKRKY